jgi:hypothetical protein
MCTEALWNKKIYSWFQFYIHTYVCTYRSAEHGSPRENAEWSAAQYVDGLLQSYRAPHGTPIRWWCKAIERYLKRRRKKWVDAAAKNYTLHGGRKGKLKAIVYSYS